MKSPSILTAALAALAAATLSISAAPALAADADRQGAMVSYDDLDLTTETGRVELAKRFDDAARKICDAPEGKLRGKARYCYENTSKSLKTRVATIISEHEAKGG